MRHYSTEDLSTDDFETPLALRLVRKWKNLTPKSDRSNRKSKSKVVDHYAAWVNDKLENLLYGDDASLKENYCFIE